MNYKDFNIGDWIGHISGVIEDESELDGNEMRDLVEFLTTLKPCDDYVSRVDVNRSLSELAINNAYNMPSFWCHDKKDYKVIPTKWDKGYQQALVDLEKKIAELPSVQPKQEKGEWKHGICDKCGYDWSKDAPIASVPNICPHCGADMRGGEE